MAKIVKLVLLVALCLNAFALEAFVAYVGSFGFAEVMHKSPLMFQDFCKYYTCGYIAGVGNKVDPYDQAVQLDALKAVLTPYLGEHLPPQYNFPIDYPPPVYALMKPLSMLPLPAALSIFLVASILSAFWGTYLLSGKNWRQTGLLMLGLAACIFSWRTLAMGQMTWLIVGIVAMFFHFLFREDDLSCGIALALAALKLQYALFLIIPALVLKRWRALALAAGIMAMFTLSALFAFGDAVFTEYPKVVANTEAADPYIASMPCVRGLSTALGAGSATQTLTAIGVLCGLAIVFAVWIYVVRHPARSRTWAVALMMPIVLLTSPHTHSYDSLLLFVPAILILPTLDPFKLFATGGRWQRLWSIIIWTFPFTSWLIFEGVSDRSVWQIVLLMSVYVLLALATVMQMRSLAQRQKIVETN